MRSGASSKAAFHSYFLSAYAAVRSARPAPIMNRIFISSRRRVHSTIESAAHEIIAVIMALAAVETSEMDSDVAEFEKRLYVDQLREELSTRLASSRGTDVPERKYRWINCWCNGPAEPVFLEVHVVSIEQSLAETRRRHRISTP